MLFFILGTELVHDDSEKCLLSELSNLRSSQKKLEACLDRVKDQVTIKKKNYRLIYYKKKYYACFFFVKLRNCRASQNQLQLDMKNKESALGIDTLCHQLNNYSHGIQYYSGIEKYDPW